MSAPFVPNAVHRFNARAAMRGAMQVILPAALLVALPNLIPQIYSIMTGSGIQRKILELMQDNRSFIYTNDMNAMVREFQDYFTSPAGYMPILLTVLGFLIQPALLLGYTKMLLNRMTGGDAALSDMRAMLPMAFKAIWMNLLIALRVLVWWLPGLVLTFGMSCMFISTLDAGWLSAMPMVTMISVALIVRAMFMYCLAPHVLAMDPDKTAVQCIRESAALMNGRKLTYMGLRLGYLGWEFLAVFPALMFEGVLATTLQMTLTLIVDVYVAFGTVSFFCHESGLTICPKEIKNENRA